MHVAVVWALVQLLSLLLLHFWALCIKLLFELFDRLYALIFKPLFEFDHLYALIFNRLMGL
jgi:hypothetical protein